MSHVIVHRNHLGFLRSYSDGSELRPFHMEQKPQPSDRRLSEIIAAERALTTLSIITEHAEISEIGKKRMRDAMAVIQWALEVDLPELDLDRSLEMQRMTVAG